MRERAWEVSSGGADGNLAPGGQEEGGELDRCRSSRRVLGPRERAAQLPVLKEWSENEEGWRQPGGKAPDERIRERAWQSAWCGAGATEGAGRGWTSLSRQAPEENTERGPSPDPIKGCHDPTQLHRVALAPLLALLQPPLQPVLISWFLKVSKLSHPPGPPSPTSKRSPSFTRHPLVPTKPSVTTLLLPSLRQVTLLSAL